MAPCTVPVPRSVNAHSAPSACAHLVALIRGLHCCAQALDGAVLPWLQLRLLRVFGAVPSLRALACPLVCLVLCLSIPAVHQCVCTSCVESAHKHSSKRLSTNFMQEQSTRLRQLRELCQNAIMGQASTQWYNIALDQGWFNANSIHTAAFPYQDMHGPNVLSACTDWALPQPLTASNKVCPGACVGRLSQRGGAHLR